MNFRDSLDTLFLISHEMIDTRGEDSFCCAHCADAAIVSVFDGCGGLGSRTYRDFGGNTGAYMASRLLSGAAHSWFRDHHDRPFADCAQLAGSMTAYFNKAYTLAASRIREESRIRGSMVRDLPTTGAIAFARQEGDAIRLYVLWAGDSRVYLLNKEGLAQLTQDDAEGGDALHALTNDAALTNLLSCDGKYTLHCRTLEVREPCAILAATDGCFGYIPTPMEFEYTLLSALRSAKNVDELRKMIREAILSVAGDDFTLGWMSFFCGTYEKLQNAFAPRLEELEKDYITPLRTGHATASTLWGSYRRGYERYL